MRGCVALLLVLGLAPVGGAWAAQHDPRVRLEEPERGERRFMAPAAIPLEADARAGKGRAIARVEFFADGQQIGMVTSAPYAMTWSDVPEGNYRLRARATDDRGATDWSPVVRVRVRENREPRVYLSAPRPGQSYSAPATIEFRAQARDRDHHLERVEFYANGVLIGTDTTRRFSFTWTPVAAGTYQVMARAVDARGAADDSRVVIITVTGDQNQAPSVALTAPPAGALYHAPASIALAASAQDTDGTVAQVEFLQGTMLLATATNAPYTFTLNNAAAGAYSFTARATDDQGATNTSAPLTVTVNAPPTASLTSPANSATFMAPATIPLSAQVADPDGTIARVEFYNGANLIGELTAPPFNTDWLLVPAGSYSLTARVTDNLGAITVSESVSVTVNQAPAQIYYVHTDHLSTPRAIYNQQQQLVWRWDNTDPFGGNVPGENPSGLGAFTCNLRLPGQYFDRETNLHYNYFRDYDPGVGRYFQSDPIGLRGGINTYMYALGQPISRRDNFGLRDVIVVVWGRSFLPDVLNLAPSVGHAMVAEVNGTVLSSSYPQNGRPEGPQVQREWIETSATQIWDPAGIFRVTVKDDGAFNAKIQEMNSLSRWFALPRLRSDTTNCVVSTASALQAGGLEMSNPWVFDTPNDLLSELRQLSKLSGTGVKRLYRVPWQ